MHHKQENIIDKIWNSHVVLKKEGHPALFAIDLHLLHEVTSAQAFAMLKEKNLKVKWPQRCLATIDHSIPTRKDRYNIYDERAKNQIETLRKNCRDFGIDLMDLDSGKQGIVHVIAPELGRIHPGMTVVCGDSHTSTHGAFGALAFGIGTTEVGLVLATGCLLQKKPKTMRVEFTGKLKAGVFAKDLILKLISEIGIGGANRYIIEYTGEVIEKMSMEERMTVCNMSIECGARAGLISPDKTTFTYLKEKLNLNNNNFHALIKKWEQFKSDTDADYDRMIQINLEALDPMISWGTNPGQSIMMNEEIPNFKNLKESDLESAEKALNYTQLKYGQSLIGVPIQWAFLGSCTNGRIEDLRIAAKILKEQSIYPNVTCYIVPGSEQVKKQAEEEGLDKIFEKAGAKWRMPGCSLCLGMNDDKVPSGMRCISSSNRNFIGRQGSGSITHLAIKGVISSPLEYFS